MAEVPNSSPESRDDKPLIPADQFKKEEADKASREWSARIQKENEREEKALRLAANEARAEARKQRRGTSVSAAEDIADAKERKELKEYFRKTHKTGEFEYDKGDKDVDLSDKKGIKLEGTTDASWFDLDVKRPASWYQQLAEDAVKIKELRGHIKTNLTPDAQAEIDKLIDLAVLIKDTAVVKNRFEQDNWNDVLLGAVSSKEKLLGSQGLYNYILAFRRAASKKEGKRTVRRDLSEKDFSAGVDGKIKFASINLNLSSDKKGSKFRETVISGYDDKKTVEEPKPEPKAALKTEGPDKKAIEAAKVKFEAEVARVRGMLKPVIEDFKARYGAEIEIEDSEIANGDVLFTLDVKYSKIGRKFYTRVARDGTSISFSLDRIPKLNGELSKSAEDVVAALTAKVENFLRTIKDNDKREADKQKANAEVTEKLEQDKFKENLAAFFAGKYINEYYSNAVVQTKVDGNYAQGVEVRGAQYGLHIDNDVYFIFVDFAGRKLTFKDVEENEKGESKLITLGEIKSGDLTTDNGRKDFAKQVGKFIFDVRKDVNERKKKAAEVAKEPVKAKESTEVVGVVETVESRFHVMKGILDKDKNLLIGERKTKDGNFVYRGDFDPATHFLRRGKSVDKNGKAEYVSIGEFVKGREGQLVQGRNEYSDNGKLEKTEEGKFDGGGNITEGRVVKFDAAGKPAETWEGKFSASGQFIEGRYTGPRSGGKTLEGTFAGAGFSLAKVDVNIKEGELLEAKKIDFDYGKDWVSSTAKTSLANAERLLK